MGVKSAVKVDGGMLVDEVRSKFELQGLARVNSTSGIISLVAGFGRIQKNSKSWSFGLPNRGYPALFYAASTPRREHMQARLSWPGLRVHSGACELLLMCKTRPVFRPMLFSSRGTRRYLAR